MYCVSFLGNESQEKNAFEIYWPLGRGNFGLIHLTLTWPILLKFSLTFVCFSPGFCGVSCFFVILARFTPYEWDNPYPEVEEPEELENQFRSKTCAFFQLSGSQIVSSEISWHNNHLKHYLYLETDFVNNANF